MSWYEDEDGVLNEGAIEREGLLYRVPYLVLPRVLIGNMPPQWQEDFVRLMDGMRDYWNWELIVNDYSVQAREDGKFVKDPLRNYRHFPEQELERLKYK